MSATEESVAPSGKGGGWRWRWLLVASLSVNLLVVGLWAGHAMRPAPPDVLTGKAGEAGEGRVAREGKQARGFDKRILRLIPESQHATWHDVYEASRPSRDALRGEMVQVHQSITEALRAAPFEPVRFEAALAERRRVAFSLRIERHQALVTLASGMSDDERGEMATRFEGFIERWTRRMEARGDGKPAVAGAEATTEN